MKIQTLMILLMLSFLTPTVSAQLISKKYPRETLASRLMSISKDYKTNIGYRSEQCNFEIPKLELKNAKINQAIKRSLPSSGFIMKIMPDSSIIIRKEDISPVKSSSIGSGRLSGTVTDDKGESIPGASVAVPGTGKGTITDVNGNYNLQVPVGKITIEASSLSYQKKKITDIDVKADNVTKLDITLSESAEQLTEVTVTAHVQRSSAAGMLLQQKASVAMTDGISSDLIKKTSDNNVAQVLKRVSGVTIQEGKYVTVRGMSERYNNVQLNGSSLPSTEPNRRNFSFDIIPSALVDNITVFKTFTPDLPAEFTGGMVLVNTLSVPEKKFLNISVGTGGNTNSTGKDFYSTKRYTSDWFLGEVDKRKWYAGDNEQSITNAIQKNSWGFYRYKAMPMQSYSLSAGIPIDLGGNNKLGLVSGFTYRHEENIETTTKSTLRTGDSITSPSHKYKFVTALGAVLNIGWQRPGHKITWNNLYNNRVTNTTLIRSIYDYYDNTPEVENYSVILIGNLVQTQVKGEHELFHDKLKLSWGADYSKSTRTNPDDRHALGSVPDYIDWGYGINDNVYTINNGHLMYSKLEGTKKNLGANLEYSFKVMNNLQKLKAGYLATFRHASYRQLYLRGGRVNGGNDIAGLSLKDYFSPQYFADGIHSYYISGTTRGGGNFYDGNQEIHAAYFMGDFCTFNKLHLIGGMRMETAHTHAESGDTVTVDKTDWLPSATVVYNLTNKINLRAAYTQTIARPDFRELSTCSYYNVEDRMVCYVEKAIKETKTTNYDFRFEWYPSSGEVFSFSVFYKQFTNPVENVAMLTSDQQNYVLRTVNLDKFNLKGMELSFRKSFGFITPVLKDLYLSGNAVLQKGNITYSYWDEIRKRPLQGLSPYSINGGLSYQGSHLGASLNYSRVGRKLLLGGRYAKSDEYENPRDVIDLQLSALFLKKKLEFKINLSDLLAQDFIIYRNKSDNLVFIDNEDPNVDDRTSLGLDYNPGDWVLNRIKKGSSFSCSVSYKF